MVWAKAAGAEVDLRDPGGRRREVTLPISRGAQRWSLRVVERRQSARVYLPEGGYAPPR